MKLRPRHVLLGLAGLGGVIYMLRKKTTSSPADEAAPDGTPVPAPAPSGSPDLAFLGTALPHFRQHPERLRRVVYLMSEWAADGRLTLDEQAILLTIAYMESGFRLNTRSADDSPDALVGHSWSMFQVSADTAATVGIQLTDLFATAVNGQYAETEIERATRANARAALANIFFKSSFARPNGWLDWARARYPNPGELARAVFIIWSGGHARGWDYSFARGRSPLRDVDPNHESGTGGYIHFQIAPRLGLWAFFRYALGLPDEGPPEDLKVSATLPDGVTW